MIHVIIPAYNCYQALVRCLATVYSQTAPRMNVVIIDDASTDPLMQEAILDMAEFCSWTAILNETNLQCPQNLCIGIEAANAKPHDIIVILDGDDWFAHKRVLERISEVYADNPSTWLTYGSYKTFPEDLDTPKTGYYPTRVNEERSFRTHNLTMFNHPITFKKFLWDALSPEVDFQYPDGTWVEGIYDEAIMYPMLEMAAEHYQHLDEVLYVYNSSNPISVRLSMPDKIREAGEYLRGLPKLPKMELQGDELVYHENPHLTPVEMLCAFYS